MEKHRLLLLPLSLPLLLLLLKQLGEFRFLQACRLVYWWVSSAVEEEVEVPRWNPLQRAGEEVEEGEGEAGPEAPCEAEAEVAVDAFALPRPQRAPPHPRPH